MPFNRQFQVLQLSFYSYFSISIIRRVKNFPSWPFKTLAAEKKVPNFCFQYIILLFLTSRLFLYEELSIKLSLNNFINVIDTYPQRYFWFYIEIDFYRNMWHIFFSLYIFTSIKLRLYENLIEVNLSFFHEWGSNFILFPEWKIVILSSVDICMHK